MALAGIDTASERSYTDDLCRHPVLLDVARRVSVEGDGSLSDTSAVLHLTLRSGETMRLEHDLAAFVAAGELARGLRRKAATLLGRDAADRIWAMTSAPDDLSARDLAGLLRS